MIMTKYMKPIQTLAALLIAVAAMTACSSENTIADEPVVKPDAPKTYTMTVQACKGDNATTRALSLNGSTLNATWTAGEVVTVYNETKAALLSGTLTAQTDGANTTLKGTLSGTIENGDKLKLKFLSPNYGTQDGTLTGSATSIDKVCDYAEASVDVTSVSGGNITTTAASFENQQAIVKFTLMKKFDNSNLEIPASKALTVNDGTNNYTVTPTSATNVLFVAIPATSTVNLSTTVGSYTYTYEKTGVTLTNGKYYAIVVKMARNVNLSSVNANFELQDGDIVTGTLANNVKISIANDATVTLDDVTIDGRDIISFEWTGITCDGDANIILVGTNTVITTANGKPAIQAGYHDTETKTLTISGSGSLTATGGPNAAGIGSGFKGECGNITISGGTVEATGGASAAGIGSGREGSCGDITISGGTVTAQGGYDGAGIGCGFGDAPSGISSKFGNITISGGTVTATGGSFGAGIGSGSFSDGVCGNITITTGVTEVTATKGDAGDSGINHSIGNGYNSTTIGTITIGCTLDDEGNPIGGTEYWGKDPNNPNEYTYKNGGETYLTKSPLIYPTPAQ